MVPNPPPDKAKPCPQSQDPSQPQAPRGPGPQAPPKSDPMTVPRPPPKPGSPPASRAPPQKGIDWEGAQKREAQFQSRLRQAHVALQAAPTSLAPIKGPPQAQPTLEESSPQILPTVSFPQVPIYPIAFLSLLPPSLSFRPFFTPRNCPLRFFLTSTV